MSSLPQKLPLDLMQTKWGAQLNPVISNPILQGAPIYNIAMQDGVEKTIPTGLNRMQLGWFIIDLNNDTKVWRTQPFNSNYLTLTCDSDVTLSLWVF